MARESRTRQSLTLFTLAFAILGATIGLSLEPVLLNDADATTVCTSGSVSTDSSQSPLVVVTFTAPASGDGSCTWTVPANVYSVDYVVVAGGGGGASGGGGAGGFATSWRSRIGATNYSASTPLSVTPGDDIAVTVGAGGSGGAGGAGRYSGTAGTLHTTAPASGNDSVFGSIRATGGGAGGHSLVQSGSGLAGGSSGGAGYDRNQNSVTAAVSTTAVGAQSFGNSGGASLAGSFSAGGGGGGAGGVGGNTHTLAAGCNAENCTTSYHGGGIGGAGIESDITGTWTAFSCGGGGGVNSNTAKVVTGGGGTAGCSTAGKGSSYSALYTNYNTGALANSVTLAQWQAAIGTAGTAGFGGGGGGTDPEDIRGGAGGSGKVILRYRTVDARCPNSTNQTLSSPVACPATAVIQANGASLDTTVLTAPISFSGTGATLTILTTPTASPTSGNMTASVVNSSQIRVSVPSGSSLIGGTYPVNYRITASNGATSESYLLVTVEDPNQITPIRLPIDPRATALTLPNFPLGDATNVLLCITEQVGDGYSNAATISSPTVAGVTRETRTRGFSWRGTRTAVQNVVSQIQLTGSTSGARLVPGTGSRIFSVNVSNTANGGNNSCSGGTRSEMEIYPVGLSFLERLIVHIG